jgi:hypothetical protein
MKMQSQRQRCRQKSLIYQKNKIRHTKAVEIAKRYDQIPVVEVFAFHLFSQCEAGKNADNKKPAGTGFTGFVLKQLS